jgi:UDP-N-acetylmuramoyl-L-alanyl-D-glutamate--2,6-diaminopimelate ligase
MALMEWWRRVDSVRVLGAIPDVPGITHDSRAVRPGEAFAAVPGRHTDGHEYLEAAQAAGAAAAVVQADREQKWASLTGRLPLLVVRDVRASLGDLAAAAYRDPSKTLRLVGVTGTNGKTTTAHLAAHVLDRCGLQCGYLSSVAFDYGEGFELNASHMTTVEATSIQSMLARAVANGRASMTVEASSEGLAQHRLEGCEFDVAVFTNLTRDHLDFHGTMESYLAAKGILFEMLDRPTAKKFPRAAVLNADDPASEYLRGGSRASVLTYGLGNSDFAAADVESQGFTTSFRLRHAGRAYAARVPLVGTFNAYNALAAVAVAACQGVTVDEAAAALQTFPGVPGRLERIDEGQAFAVYVDIASTAAALENVLTALRPATSGRLWVVFGAAGGRDPVRRTGMGEVAARLADWCVLTNEDPRDEDPDAIIAAIAGALSAAGRSEGRDFVRVPDRREAIRYAFEHAAAGDTVLLAGKATETTMVFANGAVPWNERAVARELLDAAAPEM